MFAELKGLHSPDIVNDELPSDPYDCDVLVEAFIGPKGANGQELFSFRVITVQALTKRPLPVWGRGCMIVEVFSWESIRNSITWRLDHCRRNTWQEIAQELSKYMEWEFDDYRNQPH